MAQKISKEYIKTLLPKRPSESNKGTFGNILNIAGSINYKGAAYLSTVSALKAGAGYVALAGIKEVAETVSTLCPEAVLIPLKEKFGTIKNKEYKNILKLIPKFKVLAFGCGISSINQNQKHIKRFVKNLLKEINNTDIPVIIDADGLNIISELKIQSLPKNAVLTPHPGELSRLLGIEIQKIQDKRVEYALMASQKYRSIIVLKGENTIITDGKEVFVNSTGNSALSKAGTGDVLTGMISSFCAQGASPLNSAILGVYLHGLAGEISSQKLTEYSVNASELINYIPEAIKTVLN